MAWLPIPGSTHWEYNNTPVEPDVANIGQHALWSKQVAGIRTGDNGSQTYTECRLIGSTVQTMGELNKDYYDA
jgi:hypothetical protein